ncbi:hypothetical protein Tco_0550247 [Tanacetum coccineum]
MSFPVIPIPADSSGESVGRRRLLSFRTDPSEDPPSLDHAPVAPIISAFLSDDHFKPDSKSSSSSRSIPVPSTEVAATPAIPTPSMEATVSPSVVPISPVRDTPALVTDTIPTPRIIPKGTRVSARKKVKGYKPVMTPTPKISSSSSSGSSHPLSSSESSSISDSHVSSSEISSPFSSFNTAHTSSGPLPHRRKQCLDYATPSSSTSVGPSQKRCMPSATSMLTSAHPLSSL